ncbi:MAG: hypothetical protein KCHDKBKB_02824 [Elusimicrobia bacterium]|nr:hypothetical protein [Elusimicrobiota bacterium]
MPHLLGVRTPRKRVYDGTDHWMTIQGQDEPQPMVQALVEKLQEQKTYLEEILQAIENRDISFEQVREHLKWIQKNMKETRRSSKFGISRKDKSRL